MKKRGFWRPRNLFAETIEHSLTLRLLTLAATWWAGIALGIVGAPPWAWIGGPLLATAGHAASWRLRGGKHFWWRVLVASALLALTAFMAASLPAAFGGNWRPAALYLIFIQAAASFDLRTRAGLYTSLVLSGTVLFLASQLAFSSLFLIFLAGFFLLLLGSLAISSIQDTLRHAIGRATSPLSARALTWFGWGSALAIIAAGLFLILPWSMFKPLGHGASGEAIYALTGSNLEPAQGQGTDGTAPTADASPGQRGDASGSATNASPRPAPSSPTGAGRDALPFPSSATSRGGAPANDIALRVRSPVASYWRTQVASTFDGARWLTDPGNGLDSRRRAFGRRYSQTVYVAQPQTAPSVGYTAIDWQLLSDNPAPNGIAAGVVYQATSVRVPLDEASLRQASGATPLNPSLRDRVSPAIRDLASRIVADTTDPLDRALAITQHLRGAYRYDAAASHSGTANPVDAFLFGDGSGDGLDFAGAHAALALAVGLDARVATGYLPGEFDPLSGAYTVRLRDAHAWAEVRLRIVGWVPFDAAPRTDLPLPGKSGAFGQRISTRVFSWQLGDQAQHVLASIARAAALPAALAGLVLFGAWLYRRRRRTARQRAIAYSSLGGAERRALRALHRTLEHRLRRHGIAPRSPAESLEAWFARAAAAVPVLRVDLAAFRDAVLSGVYCPDPPTPLAVDGARLFLHHAARSLR